jgi:hypothetical protein
MVVCRTFNTQKRLRMSQLETKDLRHRGRVYLGAYVSREQHERLHEAARSRDRSMSSIVRAALDRELERTENGRGA